MEDNKYTVTSSEHLPHKGYELLAKDLKGTWDGEQLSINNSWCDLEAHSFCFLDEMYVGVFNLNAKKPIVVINNPVEEEHYIVIRIGFTGSFHGKENSNKFNNLGVFIYNSSQIFEIEYPYETECQWISIRFSLSLFNKFTNASSSYKLKALFEDKTPWFNYYSLDAEIESLVKTIITNVDKDKRRHISFFTKALDIIGVLKEKMDNAESPFKKNIHPEDLKIMMQIKDEYLSDFTEQPNLTDLSLQYGMSISKLNRVFKSIFNQPILQFYNQQKIEEVFRQVSQTQKSLTEISIDLNFSHVAHMSKVFKNNYGYAPSVLRDRK